jgi:hypothetical protein
MLTKIVSLAKTMSDIAKNASKEKNKKSFDSRILFFCIRFNIAENFNLIAFGALFDFMILRELVPALFLSRSQNPGAAA